MKIIERIVSRIQVTGFIWYTRIIESRVWASIRKGLHPVTRVREDRMPAGPSTGAREASEVQEGLSMSTLPIVFLHYSNSDYLKFSLGQARHSNPESTIYLIGDEQNDCYDCVEHHSLADYSHSANAFSKVYRHFNSTGYAYELFCFQRWFILHEFLVTHKLQKCLYLDSDTMLYADVTQEQEKFAQFDFTLSFRTSGCTFFLNRVAALAEFCQFLMDIYSKKERYYYDRMLAQYATFRKNGMAGGACDMTAFDFYTYEHFGEIGEVGHIIDGSVYDPSINVQHPGFEMEDGVKKVIWKDGAPYGVHRKTAQLIRFNSLQFQGETKPLMSRYCTAAEEPEDT